MTSLTLDRDGAAHFAALAKAILPELELAFEGFPKDAAGTRIVDCPAIAGLLAADRAIGAKVADMLGDDAMPVRAILFDKSPDVNWALDWHQDRTIAVRNKCEVAGFGNWNTKQGIVHVEPPFVLLERMITVRIHLDPVDGSNGVLEIIPGSHCLGRISENSVSAIVAIGPIVTCPAEAGDCWFYRTPVLHRSSRSHSAKRRRVLQVDYSADELPGGLDWRGL